MAGQLSTTTSLSLTGVIDARDFKTMRDEMPALTNIDLSGVTIAAYSGTEGTEGTNNIYYKQDCVPQRAFYNDNGYGKTSLNSIILPNSVTSIGYLAFRDCDGLSAIEIPPQTQSIEHSSFSFCNGLMSVTIPSSVTSIKEKAFHLCDALINVDMNNPNYSSIDGVLFNKTQTELIQCPISKSGDYTIPSSVSSIVSYSFYDCKDLLTISIPSTVTSIGAFAFCGCTGLTTLAIPSSTTTIETWAFGSCDKLTTIYAYPTSPVDLSSSPYVFANVDKYNCILYVPHGSKAAYSEANQWKDFLYIVELSNQLPIASAGNDQTVDENSIFSLDGTASSDPEGTELSYLWTTPSQFTTDSVTESKPTFTAPEVTKDTTFTITLVVNDGMLDSQADTIKVTVLNTIKTGIDEMDKTSKFYVYPNPTTGLVKVSMNDLIEQFYTIEVYNGMGQLKLSREKASCIDLSSFSSGIYLIKLNARTKSYFQKIIKN